MSAYIPGEYLNYLTKEDMKEECDDEIRTGKDIS